MTNGYRDVSANLPARELSLPFMKLETTPYLEQKSRWPEDGEHILAHYDDESIVVYQAYRPAIGLYAIEHGRLDGPQFSLSRMSWIKPNFLWMMFRNGWGVKQDQEITLALRIRRRFFDSLLEAAVASTFNSSGYESKGAWQEAVKGSDVRRQWDPDHAPNGAKVQRRAVQLGLRGAALRALAHEELLEVIDMTAFVAQQRANVQQLSQLLTPTERVYTPGGSA